MVREIDDKTIMTRSEARSNYRKFYIGMVFQERNYQNPESEKGYVVYVADSYDESFDIPRKLDDGSHVSVVTGHAVGGIEIGSVYIGE